MLFEKTSFIFNIVFIIWIFILMNKIKVLRKENNHLLRESNIYDDLKAEAEHKLKFSSEMETIKYLRTEKGLSMLEAKKMVDDMKK